MRLAQIRVCERNNGIIENVIYTVQGETKNQAGKKETIATSNNIRQALIQETT